MIAVFLHGAYGGTLQSQRVELFDAELLSENLEQVSNNAWEDSILLPQTQQSLYITDT